MVPVSEKDERPVELRNRRSLDLRKPIESHQDGFVAGIGLDYHLLFEPKQIQLVPGDD